MQKSFFVFLMAVAIVLPLATAYNCTALDGENKRICNYIEDQDWSQSEKDSVIQNAIDNGESLDGSFESIINQPIPDVIQLNTLEEAGYKINEDDKKFLIDFSSISLFFYVAYSFVKKYYFLLEFL